MPYVKGMLHEVDFKDYLDRNGADTITDLWGVQHPIQKVDIILAKSMFKGCGWLTGSGMSWEDYWVVFRKYRHALYITNVSKEKPEKTNLAFTVVDEARLPEELLKLVAEKKEASFKMTYADSGYLYLCVGYGKQDSGGYSITVDDLYASGEMIYLDTSLIGPKQAKELGETPSYPYIVIKTPFEDKTVVFD